MPQEIDIRRQIAADPSAVFVLLGDSSTWPSWTPIDRFELERAGDPATGLGEVRLFHTGRITVREEIIERDPDRRLGYRLLGGLAVRDYVALIDLTPAEGGTSMRWRTTFAAKVPGTGWIYRRALERATKQFCDGLKSAAERG